MDALQLKFEISKTGENKFRVYDINSDYWILVEDDEIVDSFRNRWDSTPEEWKQKALNWLKENKPTKPIGKTVYIRSGKPPESGFSFNYRDNTMEPGVSCYPATQTGKTIALDLAGLDKVSALFIISGDRDWYILSGEVIGTGSDGEPCLSVSKYRKVRKDYEILIANN